MISLIIDSKLIGFSFNEYFGLLLLGIIPTIMGHGSMYFAMRYVSPTIVAAIPMGEPIIASILAWFLFNEIITKFTLIGGTITIIGLFILIRNKS